MLVSSPLSVPVSKKNKFILNLNNYRNTHFYSLNTAKREYKALISHLLKGQSFKMPIQITYCYYPKTKRKTDLGNVLSVHQKFFEDALTELKCIPDDDYTQIIQSTFTFGTVDPENPRVDIFITESP